MAFAVPQPFSKRLKAMDPNGKEVREGWDPMDMSYMQLLDTAGPMEDAPVEAEEAPPDPGEIVKIFEDAKGNLDILVDVVANLERSFMEAKAFSTGRRPGVKREDAVANSLQSRVAATSASLGRVSSRLAAGVELLQAHVAREDRFYQQLRQLQMFWKVHLNPRVIDCPFIVDLSLPEPSAAGGGAPSTTAGGGIIGPDSTAAAGAGSGSAAASVAASSLAAGQALTGNTYELGSGSLLVPLMKDDSGALRVQLELPPGRPDVNDPARVGETRLNGKGARTQQVLGSRRVHALLLQLHRRQLWGQVAAGLERDAAGLGFPRAAVAGGAAGGGGASGGGHPVHISLARLAAQNVLRTRDPSLAALRPLMLEHLVACRLPPPYKPPPPRPGSGPKGLAHLGAHSGGGVLSGLPLLPDLAALLNQLVFRDHQMYHLDLEAHALPYITLRWRPCSTSMLTSAMEIRVGPSHRVLVLVRDGRTDVEGVVQATGPSAGSGAGGSRWVRDTHMGFSRHDVPCVLRAVLQTLGMPLDRLLGVSVPAQHAPHHGGGAPSVPAGPSLLMALQSRQTSGGGAARFSNLRLQPQQPCSTENAHLHTPQQHQQLLQLQHLVPGASGQGHGPGSRSTNHFQTQAPQHLTDGLLPQTPGTTQHHGQGVVQRQYLQQQQQQQQYVHGEPATGMLREAGIATMDVSQQRPLQPLAAHSYSHPALLPAVSPELQPASESPQVPGWETAHQYPQPSAQALQPQWLPGSVPMSVGAAAWEPQQQPQQQPQQLQQRQVLHREQPQDSQLQQTSSPTTWGQSLAQQPPVSQPQQQLQQQQHHYVQQQYQQHPQQLQYLQQQQQQQYHHHHHQQQQQQQPFPQLPGQSQQQFPYGGGATGTSAQGAWG